tara:strand:+ start:2716 stop:3600 length:885 start_codon:yes stop_codon:yes gene_type:complete
LAQFFWKHVSEERPLAMITVLSTSGSTYSKAGSQMLVNNSGDFHGMLSGGCLEGDLAERSKKVIEEGVSEVFTYNLFGDDEIFGLGVGCEGSMNILMQPLNSENNYQPFRKLLDTLESSSEAKALTNNMSLQFDSICIKAPIRILILGAGLDADPLVSIASLLGWDVSVSDHRPSFIERMKKNVDVNAICMPCQRISTELNLSRFNAAVVMSHNLEADRSYLSALSKSSIKFIGLLGPLHRRERILKDLKFEAQALDGRLRGPVGKKIGGRGPAAIALEIAAELQSYFHKSKHN